MVEVVNCLKENNNETTEDDFDALLNELRGEEPLIEDSEKKIWEQEGVIPNIVYGDDREHDFDGFDEEHLDMPSLVQVPLVQNITVETEPPKLTGKKNKIDELK